MKIKIDNDLKQEILNGIAEAQKVIDYEMSISEDLRYLDRIEKSNKYINEMLGYLKSGFLKLT